MLEGTAWEFDCIDEEEEFVEEHPFQFCAVDLADVYFDLHSARVSLYDRRGEEAGMLTLGRMCSLRVKGAEALRAVVDRYGITLREGGEKALKEGGFEREAMANDMIEVAEVVEDLVGRN